MRNLAVKKKKKEKRREKETEVNLIEQIKSTTQKYLKRLFQAHK